MRSSRYTSRSIYLPRGDFVTTSLFMSRKKTNTSIFQLEFLPTLKDRVASLNWKQYAMVGAVIIDVKLVVSGWLHEEESRDLLSHAAIGLALVYATNHFGECDLHDRLKEENGKLKEQVDELKRIQERFSKLDENAGQLLLQLGLNIRTQHEGALTQQSNIQQLMIGIQTLAKETIGEFALRIQDIQTEALAIRTEVNRQKEQNDRHALLLEGQRLENDRQRQFTLALEAFQQNVVVLPLDPPRRIAMGPLALTFNQ
jgi:hypothetical protein